MDNQKRLFIALAAVVVGVMMLVAISNQSIEKEFGMVAGKKLASKEKNIVKNSLPSKKPSKSKKKKLKGKLSAASQPSEGAVLPSDENESN